MLKSMKRRTKRDEKHITFEYTGNKKDISINVTHVRVLPGVINIDDGAFQNRVRLESITFSSTVVEMGVDAFRGCNNLREVVFNDGLKKIGLGVFRQIKLPYTVLETGDMAFYKCSSLRTVVLNEGPKKIDSHAFADCKPLQSITLPSTVTTIRSYAFAGCDRLREVVILNECDRHGIIKQVMLACISVRKLNFTGLSKRLENISKIDYWSSVVEDKIDAIPQIARRDSGGFLISTRDRGNRVHWKPVKQSFDKMYKLISYYELKEATSLFELALWKAKIDQVDDVVDLATRDAYRIEVPGPVKDTIIQYIRIR